MVDSRREVNLRWLEWVVGREMDCEEEDAALERTVTLRRDRCQALRPIETR